MEKKEISLLFIVSRLVGDELAHLLDVENGEDKVNLWRSQGQAAEMRAAMEMCITVTLCQVYST